MLLLLCKLTQEEGTTPVAKTQPDTTLVRNMGGLVSR